MSITTVRLPPEAEKDLELLAGKLERSKGWIINQALTEYLAKHRREQQRWQETLDAMESVAQGRVVSSDKVHQWLRSWGSEDELPAPGVGE